MNLARISCLAILTAAAAAATDPPAPFCAGPGPAGPRLVVAISDLHLGVGLHDRAGGWHNSEDFRWASDFAAFLAAIDQRGQGKTTLVVAGDAFELWQSLADDCAAPSKNQSCSEAEALARLERVIGQHRRELDLLGKLAAAGDNRVVLVPGNHDAALLFDSVAAKAVASIAAPGGRVCVAREGYWASPDGLIFAEHGHQIGEDVNAFDYWPLPFSGTASERRLQKTWGEAFVQHFYNEYELEYPVIDNITEEGIGVLYGMSAEGQLGQAMAAGKFLKFFAMKSSWKQLTSSLSKESAPIWDVDKARKQPDLLLIEAAPPDSPLHGALELFAAGGAVDFSVIELEDHEVRALCDRREAARRSAAARGETAGPGCPTEGASLGAAAQALFGSDREIWAQHLEDAYRRLKQDRPGTRKRFSAFVYGHTHRAEAPSLPLENWPVTVVNTGAWQRVIAEDELKRLRRECGLSHRELLKVLDLDHLSACYSAVIVDPYETSPEPHLMFWSSGGDGSFALHESCGLPALTCPGS